MWDVGISLTVAFRASGWQWPLRPGDVVRVYTAQNGQMVELPAELVIAVLQHHLSAVRLQGRMTEACQPSHVEKPMRPEPPSKPPTPAPRLRAATGRKLRGLA